MEIQKVFTVSVLDSGHTPVIPVLVGLYCIRTYYYIRVYYKAVKLAILLYCVLV